LVWVVFLGLVPQGLQPPGPQLDDVAFLVVVGFFGFFSLFGFDFVGLGAQGQLEQEAHPDIFGTPDITDHYTNVQLSHFSWLHVFYTVCVFASFCFVKSIRLHFLKWEKVDI
jgi:hypothetical protein